MSSGSAARGRRARRSAASASSESLVPSSEELGLEPAGGVADLVVGRADGREPLGGAVGRELADQLQVAPADLRLVGVGGQSQDFVRVAHDGSASFRPPSWAAWATGGAAILVKIVIDLVVRSSPCRHSVEHVEESRSRAAACPRRSPRTAGPWARRSGRPAWRGSRIAGSSAASIGSVDASARFKAFSKCLRAPENVGPVRTLLELVHRGQHQESRRLGKSLIPFFTIFSKSASWRGGKEGSRRRGPGPLRDT